MQLVIIALISHVCNADDSCTFTVRFLVNWQVGEFQFTDRKHDRLASGTKTLKGWYQEYFRLSLKDQSDAEMCYEDM